MKKARETNENYEEGLLKLVRTLPTVGRGSRLFLCAGAVSHVMTTPMFRFSSKRSPADDW